MQCRSLLLESSLSLSRIPHEGNDLYYRAIASYNERETKRQSKLTYLIGIVTDDYRSGIPLLTYFPVLVSVEESCRVISHVIAYTVWEKALLNLSLARSVVDQERNLRIAKPSVNVWLMLLFFIIS